MKPRTLTEKQQRFVEAYAGPAKGNASEAARKAGYSPKTAHRIGQENMQKPAIRDAIAAIAQQTRDKAIATVEEVKAILSAIARDKTADDKDRIAAGDKLLKCAGEYMQKLEVDHKTAKVVVYTPANPRIPPPPTDV